MLMNVPPGYTHIARLKGFLSLHATPKTIIERQTYVEYDVIIKLVAGKNV